MNPQNGPPPARSPARGRAPKPGRRTLLRASATLPLAGATGCTDALLGNRNAVRVAVSWGGAELTAFRAVLDRALRRAPRARYEVDPIPLGDDIEAAIGARGIDRPDVVMLPRAGLVGDHLDELVPIPKRLWNTAQFHPTWKELLYHHPPGTLQEKRPFGLPFKAAHKSAIWYNRRLFQPDRTPRADPRTSWALWIDRVHQMAERHSRGQDVAPLALGGADGWMLTDLFENVLLAGNPGVYRLLSGWRPANSGGQGAGVRPWGSVEPTLRRLALLWGPAGALSGGVGKSLSMQFPDAVLEVFSYHRASMVVAPDFAEPIVRTAVERGRIRPEDVGVFRFPALEGNPAPLISGGDVAVLTRPARDEAVDLVRRLADPAAPRPWIRERGGFIPANQHAAAAAVYSDAIRPLAEDLRLQDGIRFDLSDLLGPVGGRAGLWRVLQDFLIQTGDRFGNVKGGTAGAIVDRAAGDAVRRLKAFERDRRRS